MSKIDRIGEKNINNFGSEMVIIEYKNVHDIDVYFPEYDWTFKSATYQSFKKGSIKYPYDRSIYGVGYIGEGEYKIWENDKTTKVYDTWQSMLKRCYSEKYHKKRPTYIGCEVYEEWYNFQNFAKWYYDNYYEVEGERMHLDKDILVKHNKIYSPETCVFVPKTINLLFVKNDKNRGESAIGTSLTEYSKYRVQCHLINPKTGKSKNEYLGYYDTELEAFEVYKHYKEKNIKQVADYFKNQISERLYNGLYRYEVEIDD